MSKKRYHWCLSLTSDQVDELLGARPDVDARMAELDSEVRAVAARFDDLPLQVNVLVTDEAQ